MSNKNSTKQAKYCPHNLLLVAERLNDFNQLAIHAIQSDGETGTILVPLFHNSELLDDLVHHLRISHESHEAQLKAKFFGGGVK